MAADDGRGSRGGTATGSKRTRPYRRRSVRAARLTGAAEAASSRRQKPRRNRKRREATAGSSARRAVYRAATGRHVPGLVERAFGTRFLAAATGWRGERRRRKAKAAAANVNGANGGLPAS